MICMFHRPECYHSYHRRVICIVNLSSARAKDPILLMQLSDPVTRSRSRPSRDCLGLVIVESLIRWYFTLVFFCEDDDYFVNKFSFRMNNRRWSWIKCQKRTCLIVLWICYKSCSLVICYSRQFCNNQYERLIHERIKKVQYFFVMIIVQNIKIEISTLNNFVITISKNNT